MSDDLIEAVEGRKEKHPRGFWKSETVSKAIAKFVNNEVGLAEVAYEVQQYADSLGSHGKKIGQGTIKYYVAEAVRKSTVLTTVQKQEFIKLIDSTDLAGAGKIKWAKFFGLTHEEEFDLRRVASMVYASEALVNAKPEVIAQAGLYDMRRKAQEYISLWANRFAKYVLAACMGEWRHRYVSGEVDLGIKAKGKGEYAPREAMQTAAVLLWGDSPDLADEARVKIKTALDYMEKKFGDRAFFPGSGYGGPRWGKIAKTLNLWVSRKIPDVVWVDYVWDIVHNGGCLFNKAAGMFTNESATRSLLSKKRTSKEGDVLEWGGAHLHPDWEKAIALLNTAKMGAETKSGEDSWIGSRLGGQTLFGGDD